MRLLIYIIYGVFIFLITFTFYLSNHYYEGIVEPNYYERSKDYFLKREREEALGLKLFLLNDFKKGDNDFKVKIGLKERVLRGAKVRLFIGNISSSEYDHTYDLKEISPGIYGAFINLPFNGRWILRLDIESDRIKTEKRWVVDID